MPSEREVIIEQKRRLYLLLVAQRSSDELPMFISQTKNEMSKEDIASVEKQVEEYFAEKKSK